MLRGAFMKKKAKERKANKKKRKAASMTVSTKRGLNSSRTISNKKPATSLYRPLKIEPNSNLVTQQPSKYAATLIDPFRFRGIRIPDLACHPSVTYSLEYDTTITLTGGSTAEGAYDGIIIPLCGNPGFKYYNNTNGRMSGALSANGTLVSQTCFGNATNIATSYSQSRIVSAQCVVKFAGDDNAQSGSIVGAFVQAGDTNGSGGQSNLALTSRWLDQASQAAGTADFFNLIEGVPLQNPEFLKRRQSFMGPISDGIILQFRPADADDFIYRQTSNGVNQTALGAVPIFNINCGFIFGIRSVTGGATRTFTMSVVVNFEALPVDDNIGLPGVGVYVNPSAQAYGLNAAANFPIVTSATSLDFARQAKAVSGL